MNQSRLSISHNKTTQLLTIVCTKDIEIGIIDKFKCICPVEMMQAERSIEDDYNDDGDLFKDCVVITTKVAADIIEPFFESVLTNLRHGIAKSIHHSDN
jgi:hypothetical protein